MIGLAMYEGKTKQFLTPEERHNFFMDVRY